MTLDMGYTTLFLSLLTVFAALPDVKLAYAQKATQGPTPTQTQNCKQLLIRKEWRTLTHNEKAGWIGAVKCLANIRHERLSFTEGQRVLQGKRSLYDDFSYSHAAVEHSAHRNAYFLPWHRWFLYLFDSSLRRTCGYNGPTPYWDWTLDHEDLFHSPVFEDSPQYGLGGTGDCDSSPEADCTVATGAFAPSSSSTDNFELAWPIPHPLRRNLTLITGWFANESPQNRTLSAEFVLNATEKTTGDFFRFQYAMTQLHNHVHNFVGGDLAGDCPKLVPEKECQGTMASSFTPNDPLFWLHHAQLDRLWNQWQHHHKSNFAAFSGVPLHPKNMTDSRYDRGANVDHLMPFDVQSAPVAPRMVLETESWPLCYQYVSGE